ncbi:MAG: DUF6616 family protein [Pseudomonadota bacterium]
MHIYVELWKPKPAWIGLSDNERKSFIDSLFPVIGMLTESGVKLLSFAINDEDTEYKADFKYIAVWQMPDKEKAVFFEQEVIKTGFHDYFEQVNARGESVPPDVLLGDMAIVL